MAAGKLPPGHCADTSENSLDVIKLAQLTNLSPEISLRELCDMTQTISGPDN